MSDQADTRALRALMEKATKGEWFVHSGSIAIEECDPENGPYPVQVMDGGPGDVALVAALVNAAPALLDAADERDRLRAESEHFNERIDKLSRRVSHYENALCASPPRLWALPPDGTLTGHIEPERVGEVLAERDALRARVAQLEAENARLRTPLRPIVDRIHRAMGCSEHSDDESLPEMVETWVREHREKVAELERENARAKEVLAECWNAGAAYLMPKDYGEFRNGIHPRVEEWIASALAPRAEVKP